MGGIKDGHFRFTSLSVVGAVGWMFACGLVRLGCNAIGCTLCGWAAEFSADRQCICTGVSSVHKSEVRVCVVFSQECVRYRIWLLRVVYVVPKCGSSQGLALR